MYIFPCPAPIPLHMQLPSKVQSLLIPISTSLPCHSSVLGQPTLSGTRASSHFDEIHCCFSYIPNWINKSLKNGQKLVFTP